MAVRKTEKGASLRRWFKNKNTKKCRPSKRISKNTPKIWSEMSAKQKANAVAEKKRVGMGKNTSRIT